MFSPLHSHTRFHDKQDSHPVLPALPLSYHILHLSSYVLMIGGAFMGRQKQINTMIACISTGISAEMEAKKIHQQAERLLKCKRPPLLHC